MADRTQLDEAAPGQETSGRNGELARTAAKVVGPALAAALLAAAAAAAKGLLERQRGSEEQTQPKDMEESPQQPAPEEDEESAAEDAAGAETPAPEQAQGPSDEPESDQAGDEGAGAATGEERPQAAEDAEEPDEQEQDVAEGVSGGEAGEVVAQARRQLEGLLGVEPERVSGLARENGGWSVMLEVVEVARVPESTDVLGTYELRLDDDLKIVSVNRERRYRRSQVDEAP
jgi:Gas vesicle synthesis protein GvpO